MIEFSINTKKQFWHCRQCDTGGDVIALVRHLDGVNFPTALTTLTGEPAPKTNSHAQVHNTAVGREGIAARFDYNDESGNLLFQVRRIEYEMLDGSFILNKDGKHKKTFRQKRPDPAKPGAWIQNVDGVRTIPYKLPELIEAIGLGHEVIIVEGEGKVDLLRTWNIPATCCAQGADQWKPAHSEFLRGANVLILPDNDAAGRKHANAVGASLQGIALSVRILELPGLPPKGDIIDWANNGGTVEQLHDLIAREAHPWVPIPESVPEPPPEQPTEDADARDETNSDTDDEPKSARVELLSSAAFISSYVPPDYLIEGLLQRRFFYSLTGKTGGGKTAIALLFAALVALGRTMDGKEFSQGRVLYLAGENPVDVQQRWIAMAQQIDFDGESIDVHFIPGVFSVPAMRACIAEQVETLGGVSLVIIDTSAAYFEGDDENSNTQLGQYARMQRSLVNLPGGPTVLALCHPVKNAADDNLLPRGGGAYLNECDGNLTAQNNNGLIEIHWQGKFRGPDFAPMSFQLHTVTHERLKDSKGKLIPTVVAKHLSEAGEQELKAVARSNEDRLLTLLAANRGASMAELAKLGEWRKRDGGPNRTLVWRLIQSLKKAKLVADGRNGLELTDAGKKAAKTIPAQTATGGTHG